MSILQLWGKELQNRRKKAGLTQGQLIEQLSLLINELSDREQDVLSAIDIYEEAMAYFNGILDSPTLSRLEKGTRTLKSRQRCVALVWGLERIGALPTIEEANHFLEIGGHGNLTHAESATIFPSNRSAVEEEWHLVGEEEEDGDAQLLTTKPDASQEPARHGDTQEHQPNQRGEESHYSPLAMSGIVALLFATIIIGYLFFQRSNPDKPSALSDNMATNMTTFEADKTTDNMRALNQPTIHTLFAESLTSHFGEIGKGQTFVNLHELDQVGAADDWNRHVKFIPVDAPYRGYRAYSVPAYVYKSASLPVVTAIRVETNYRGRGVDGQIWTWRLYNWVDQGWVTLGDNSGTHWWGDWQMLSFTAAGTLTDYINAHTGEIQLEVQANNMSDTMDLDYETVLVALYPSLP